MQKTPLFCLAKTGGLMPSSMMTITKPLIPSAEITGFINATTAAGYWKKLGINSANKLTRCCFGSIIKQIYNEKGVFVC
jgi:hypothetical protein